MKKMENESTLTSFWTDALGLEFRKAAPIDENNYCSIYRATYRSDSDRSVPCIVKQYRGDATDLVRAEAEALDFYSETVADMPEFLTSRCLGFSPETNLLAIEYVSGVRFTRQAYGGIVSGGSRRATVKFCRQLGRLLRRFHDRSAREGVALSPMLGDYIRYLGQRLYASGPIGKKLFSHGEIEGEALFEKAVEDSKVVSFCHGDLVFRNIHILGNRMGLIDFANTNWESHILNDLYNFHFATANMWLPGSMKRAMLEAITEGIGDLTFPESLHRFYYEYHRRRWLMLKLTSNRRWHQFQAVRGLARFARQYVPGRRGPFESLVQ